MEIRLDSELGGAQGRSREMDGASNYRASISPDSKLAAMNNASQFALAWSDYRQRCRWFLGVWFGGLIVAAVLTLLATLAQKPEYTEHVVMVLGLPWLIALMTLGSRFSMFICPRCDQFFAGPNLFARRCIYCGLPRGSDSDVHAVQADLSLPFAMTPAAATYVRYRLKVLPREEKTFLIQADGLGEALDERGEKFRWYHHGENFLLGYYRCAEQPPADYIVLFGRRVFMTPDTSQRITGRKLTVRLVTARYNWFWKVTRHVLVAV